MGCVTCIYYESGIDDYFKGHCRKKNIFVNYDSKKCNQYESIAKMIIESHIDDDFFFLN